MSLKLYCSLSLLFLTLGCVANHPKYGIIPAMIDTPKNFYSFLNTNSLNVEIVVHGFASGTIEETNGVIRQVTGDFWKAEFVYNQPSIIWFKKNTDSSLIEQCKGFSLTPNEAVEILLKQVKKYDLMVIELKDEKRTKIVLDIKTYLFD